MTQIESFSSKDHQPLKICCLSDLHTEFRNGVPVKISESDCDVFILAGDVGDPFAPIYKIQLQRFIGRSKVVLIVAGNHEHWQTKFNKSESFESIHQRIHQICDLLNQNQSLTRFFFLEKQWIKINQYFFIGCTLWTEPDDSDSKIMNDFNNIHQWNQSLCINRCQESKRWLKSTIDELKLNHGASKGSIIVITHHLPTMKIFDSTLGKTGLPVLKSRHTHKTANATETDLLSDVGHWFCGHVHEFVDTMIDGCRLIINPIGYPNQSTRHHRRWYIHLPELVETGTGLYNTEPDVDNLLAN